MSPGLPGLVMLGWNPGAPPPHARQGFSPRLDTGLLKESQAEGLQVRLDHNPWEGHNRQPKSQVF